MDKDEFSILMDQVIVRENLDGNSAQEPKKKVRIMVCADFEDSSNPQEKFYHFTPVTIDDLPPFRLCHPKYWEENNKPLFPEAQKGKIRELEIEEVKGGLSKLFY